ncbi:DUF4097 family beta strand repeat-containing protein [Streptomyces sp. NBC_01465]|uniref:DUF4097 family beta strand repeat-containing protein n=1 Tax=Streptomyces sp. NBC_01465 TaxID=2903878 RepID=UPI002E332D08|nr:DUF4097 family beta strand repeat-containing protein [Streptomyces sp. NBC_01465]
MIIVALRTRTLLAAGGAVLVSVAVTGCGADAGDAKAEHKSFALSGKTLTVDSDNSQIELVPADVKDVEVTRRVDGWVFMGTGPEAKWSMKDGTLTLRVKCDAVASSCAARHEIRVPRGVAVTVRDGNGGVTATGFSTPLKVSSGNGRVTVRNSSGALDLDSDNGKVEGEGISAKSVVAGSHNGGVRLTLTSVPDRVETSSNNGAVEVTLPKQAGLTYKVSTKSHNGDVNVSVPRSDTSAHVVRATSDNGEVTVRSAN